MLSLIPTDKVDNSDTASLGSFKASYKFGEDLLEIKKKDGVREKSAFANQLDLDDDQQSQQNSPNSAQTPVVIK